MRAFEIILLLTASILPILFIFKPGIPKKNIFAILIGIVFILHLVMEGLRWQMHPCYIIILVTLMLWKKAEWKAWNLFTKILITAGFIIVLVFSWCLPIILPVFKLPAPTGQFAVGSRYIHIITDRPELITPDQQDQRELMLKVWYPAQIGAENLEEYLDKGSRLGFATKYELPSWSMNYLDLIKTHTYKHPEVANGKFRF
ncbi:hypothetical protein [Zunongwangia sp. HRR-M8]|uniref:hypothetical protein n=1 Tax=Zunongwangia sp. HRR-M8 TaxID=3015170 RepID=UPI0022DD66A7|nr:hypothetical protein [Zunongwangia sp. HRR-M8]WBL22715.1 hypothetical protein PBT89_01860 [Zunongwangia sp. HRR-M8]